MVSGEHTHLGLTAYVTAYVWHRLGVPEADRFVTWRGRLLYWGMLAPLSAMARMAARNDLVRNLIEPRHRVLEHQLGSGGSRTFVELAAGLSPRGTAYCRDPAVTYVEVDLPAVSARKARMIGPRRSPRHHLVPGDVRDESLYELLAPMVADGAPLAVVMEGLSAYLTRAELETVMRHVCALLRHAGGGRFLMDVNPADEITRLRGSSRMLKRAIDRVAGGRIEPPLRSAEDAAAAAAAAGFEGVVVHDPQAHPAMPGYSARGRWLLILEGEA